MLQSGDKLWHHLVWIIWKVVNFLHTYGGSHVVGIIPFTTTQSKLNSTVLRPFCNCYNVNTNLWTIIRNKNMYYIFFIQPATVILRQVALPNLYHISNQKQCINTVLWRCTTFRQQFFTFIHSIKMCVMTALRTSPSPVSCGQCLPQILLFLLVPRPSYDHRQTAKQNTNKIQIVHS